jgi:histone H2B
MPGKKQEKASKKKATGVKKHKASKSFALYIFKIIKQVSQGKMTISARGMGVLDSFVRDMFARVATEASTIVDKSQKKPVLKVKDCVTACRLAFPGELGRNAAIEGAKAVAKYLEA